MNWETLDSIEKLKITSQAIVSTNSGLGFLITNEIIAPIWESKGNFNAVLKLDLTNDVTCGNYYVFLKNITSAINIGQSLKTIISVIPPALKLCFLGIQPSFETKLSLYSATAIIDTIFKYPLLEGRDQSAFHSTYNELMINESTSSLLQTIYLVSVDLLSNYLIGVTIQPTELTHYYIDDRPSQQNQEMVTIIKVGSLALKLLPLVVKFFF